MCLLLFPNIILFHEDVMAGAVCSESSPEWSVALDPETTIQIS